MAAAPWPFPSSGGGQASRLSTLHTEPCAASSRKAALQACGHPGVHHQLYGPRGAGAALQPCQVGMIALIFSLLGGHAAWHVEPPHLVTWPHPLQGIRKTSPPSAGREEDPVHVSEQRQPPAPHLSSISP